MDVAARPTQSAPATRRPPTGFDAPAERSTLRHWRVLEAGDSTVLGEILQPDVALAIWCRRLPLPLAAWLRSLDSACLPDGRVLARRRDVPAALGELMDRSNTPAAPQRAELRRDIAQLAELFAGIMSTDLVDLRLESIHGDACWKFHRDHVAARLLTTYRGPGTQWVEPRYAVRAITEQEAYDGPLKQLAPHAVGMFRGDALPGLRGVVHRSPPIAGTGAVRLLLCLNLPSPASPELWEPAR